MSLKVFSRILRQSRNRKATWERTEKRTFQLRLQDDLPPNSMFGHCLIKTPQDLDLK